MCMGRNDRTERLMSLISLNDYDDYNLRITTTTEQQLSQIVLLDS
ncbi:hypothetical protein DERF_005615 [Dermatophagoides farinae]|uniref:Uncharacterized protein n=1 Tax=Dermatophagoides farinae TaxID=6954 RepID=A0A922L6D1_DERFA|nr:hypothetical protein DERF_005615 [Dermatophagoides farinae]